MNSVKFLLPMMTLTLEMNHESEKYLKMERKLRFRLICLVELLLQNFFEIMELRGWLFSKKMLTFYLRVVEVNEKHHFVGMLTNRVYVDDKNNC